MTAPGHGESADVVIIGGGIEGCSAAFALSKRGIGKIVVLERHTIASGGTGKSSGVVRCHYGVPSLAAMAVSSLPFFENASDVVGVDVGFRQVGYVVGVDERNVEPFRASLASQREVGVETVEITSEDVASMWPAADLEPFAAFAYEKRGGFGDGYMTAMAFGAAARRNGVDIRQNSAVAAILSDADKVTGVQLQDGSVIHTGNVVVAAGPWSVGLLAPLGIDLPIEVHREQVLLINPGTSAGSPPVFSDLISLQYLRPDSGDQILVGNSDLVGYETADPDKYSNNIDDDFLERAINKVATRLPGWPAASLASGYAGCYDATPDYNPAISHTPVTGLLVAAGFSGHGFKISPAVGELVADLVIDGYSNDPLVPEKDFRLSRFAEGDLLRSPYPYVGAGEMR